MAKPARQTREASTNQRLKRYYKIALALLIPFVPIAALLFFTPSILWTFAPNPARAIPQQQVAEEFYGRMRFYVRKATGRVPDLLWLEVIQGTWPGTVLKGTWHGSGFIRGTMITDSRSLHAGVRNPLSSPEDRARGEKIFSLITVQPVMARTAGVRRLLP